MSDASPLPVAIDVSAIPSTPAGAGRYVIELVEALARRDDLALTLVARRHDAERWPADARLRPVAPTARPLRLLFEELALSFAVRGEPAVLHGPHYSLPARCPIPAVVTVHDLTMLEHPEWHERSKVAVFGRALRLAARRAEVIIVPSEDARAAYRAHFGDERPVIVIPHGVDHARFAAVEPSPGVDRAVLDRLGIAWPYVLNISTEEPRKNLPGLVAAFGALAASHRDLRLVLGGGRGWGSEALDAAVAASGVAGRVVRLGYVAEADVPALLRGASAVAYPSFAEGFGLPALEAMACGAPLVTSARSAMAEVTADAAALVDPANPSAIAAALEDALGGGDAVAARRARGRSLASAYTWERSAARHVEVYRLAASGGRYRRRARRA